MGSCTASLWGHPVAWVQWGSVTMVLLYSPHRSFKRSNPVNPYHVGSGYVFAPATSANDSELSSDALTDDSMSMTDSSV